jgi:hypothetical protein
MKKHLKARFFLPLLAVALLAVGPVASVQAQDSKIETGVVAFNSQDFKKAVEALKTGLSNLPEVKPKNVPRGHYYLGMASYQLMAQVAQAAGGDQMAKAQEMSDLLDLSYNSMIKVRETDAENKWTDKANKQLNVLNFAFLNGGLQAMNMTVVRPSTLPTTWSMTSVVRLALPRTTPPRPWRTSKPPSPSLMPRSPNAPTN